jgi:hypothetical protein
MGYISCFPLAYVAVLCMKGAINTGMSSFAAAEAASEIPMHR